MAAQTVAARQRECCNPEMTRLPWLAMWKMYRYNAWLERRSLWQYALVMWGINFAAVVIVLAIARLIVPQFVLFLQPFTFAPMCSAGMTTGQVWDRRKQLNH